MKRAGKTKQTLKSTYTLKTKFAIACVGALSPIMVTLFAFDLNTLLANGQVEIFTVITYVVKNVALCVAACTVVYLSPDAKTPLTIFQLGVAAPAFFLGIINGSYQAQQSKQHAMFELPAIIGTASAQPVPAPANFQPRDCKRGLTASQQILKGLVGALPSDRWFVVYSSNRLEQSATGDVQDVQRKYPGRFQATICSPVDGDDRYRVVLGANLSYDAAAKLKSDAVAAGLPKDIWLWSPIN